MRRLLCVSAAVLISACGGSSNKGPSSPSPNPNPPAQNRAPSIGLASIQPTFGIQDLTQFVFNAQATDPDGDPLTYHWTIGSATRDGQTFQSAFVSGGNGQASVTVTDGKGGQATATTNSVVVGSMTGTWRGKDSVLKDYRLTLTQRGGTVTGTYFDTDFGPGEIDPAEPGTINAQGSVNLRVKQAHFGDWRFEGRMETNGRVVTGNIRGSGFQGRSFRIEKD